MSPTLDATFFALSVSRELRSERLIRAAPEHVFDTFTSPDGQREFSGTDRPGWIVESRGDLRVGGEWTIAFGPSRDALYHHRHVFEAIDRPRRVHGAELTQSLLRAGVLDELEIHLVPILLGDGRRLFEHLGSDHIELERVRVVEGEGGVTHLRYRVVAA